MGEPREGGEVIGPRRKVVRVHGDEQGDQVVLKLECGHSILIRGWKFVTSLGPLDISSRQCGECHEQGRLADRVVAAVLQWFEVQPKDVSREECLRDAVAEVTKLLRAAVEEVEPHITGSRSRAIKGLWDVMLGGVEGRESSVPGELQRVVDAQRKLAEEGPKPPSAA